MIKRLVIILAISLIAKFSIAQDYFDAVLLSQNGYLGTARSVSMGNAFGALGGDFTSASINPAGIGVYRSGEFSITPSYTFANSSADYLGSTTNRNANLFSFSNVGYVVTTDNDDLSDGIVSFSFAIGYNRLKDFKSKQRIIGNNAETTLLDYYTDYANDINNTLIFDPHFEGMAYNTYLVNDDPDPEVVQGIFFNDLGIYESEDVAGGIGYYQTGVAPHQQVKIVNTSGSLNEFVLSFAGNIQHRTYFGATIGIQTVDYLQSSRFSEFDNKDESEFFEHYDQDENVIISGAGLNLKLGFIHRISRNLRFGVAFHTPTWYALNYESDKNINAYFDQVVGDDYSGYQTVWDDNNYNTYDYQLATPYKALISAAYQYGLRLTLSVDYEYLDYGKSKFNDFSYDAFDYTNKNLDNRNYLAASNNIRGGVELKITPAVSLRGGYEFIGNAWEASHNNQEIINSNDNLSIASFGLGYRGSDYFFDFSLSRIYSQEQLSVHQIPVFQSSTYYNNVAVNKHIANLTQNRYRASFTIGMKF